MTQYAWRPLGELLIERGLIDEHELEVALREQRMTGQLLGELLVANRIVSPIDMTAALAAHHGVQLDPDAAPPGEPAARSEPSQTRAWRPLGRILVDRGLLSESSLKRALLGQRRSEASLGQILLESGDVTPAALAEALAQQQGLDVHPAVLDAARELTPVDQLTDRYELRAPSATKPLFTSVSFLDATDFAFELLHATDPEELEIVQVRERDEEVVWSYNRDESEAFRAETAAKRRRFTPQMYLVEPQDGPDGAPAA